MINMNFTLKKMFEFLDLPTDEIKVTRTKKRSVEALDAENLPTYNAEDGCGPRSRRFVEVICPKLLKTHEEKTF